MRRDSKSSKLFFTSHCIRLVTPITIILLSVFHFVYHVTKVPIQCQNLSVYLLVYPAQYLSHYTLKGKKLFHCNLEAFENKGNALAKQEQDAIK